MEIRNSLHRIRTCLWLVLGISGCTGNYLTDPISTPVFHKAGDASVQCSYTTAGQLNFDGAYALPSDYLIDIAGETWGKGLRADERMLRLSVGKFWPAANLLILAGGGLGSTRIGPNYSTTASLNVDDHEVLSGNSDFRKYFAQLNYYFLPDKRDPSKTSIGIAGRLHYLDRYNFRYDIQHVRDNASDTLREEHTDPKTSLSFDVALFGSIGYSHVSIYAQSQASIPVSGYFQDWGALMSSIGIKFDF